MNSSFFLKIVLKNSTNYDKFTEIFPPLLLIYVHFCAVYVQCRDLKKDQQKVPILTKTTWLCPSRSYYSTVGWSVEFYFDRTE